MRVLLVDDDPSLTRIIERVLAEHGCAVDTTGQAASARSMAMITAYDIIVLDLELPDGSGLSVVQGLRRDHCNTPVLMLTGTTDPAMTVRALDAGADDYVEKPVKFDVLRARMRALVRRHSGRPTAQLSAGNVSVDRMAHEVRVGGKPLQLTARELAMLVHFLRHVEEVVTRTQLLEKVLDLSFDPGTNVVDVSVSRLRKKLLAAGANITIATRRGVGYVLQPPKAS